MRRRDLLAVLGGAAVVSPLQAFAQPASLTPLVAVLWPSSPEAENVFGSALRIGLREGGFVEGTNCAITMRYANGESDRLAALAAELAALKPRVIITAADEPVVTVHRVASAVPLVISNMTGDPVAFGLAESYARPGGTVTGMTLNASGGEDALIGKRIGLLKELVPGLARIGVIGGPDSPTFVDQQNGAKEAASRLGLNALPLPVRSLEDVEAAFASGVRDGLGAFYVTGNPLMITNRVKVAEFAARAGKPTIGLVTEQVRAGLLMCYAPDLEDAWRHAGSYAAKILAGTKPGDLPIVQASKFTFVINLTTAKALGLTIPPRLLLLADEVIE